MRLTLSPLPQLAVLAKILCLLMVVMCGAVPSTVPSVSLYSTCSRGNVTVHGREVKSTVRNELNAPYQKMTTQSNGFDKKLYIFAEKSKRYICFSKKWKVISLPKKKTDDWCQFNEIYNGRYLRYRSVIDPTRYIGFNKGGKPIVSPRGRQECYNFIKLNPGGVEQHNHIISSNKGGMMKQLQRPEQHQQHQQQQHIRKSQHHHVAGHLRATKNSLIPSSESSSSSSASSSSSSRLSQLARQHRHRHSNSWKMMREDAATRRRIMRHERAPLSSSRASSSSSSSSSSSLELAGNGMMKY